jgi:hypothetical protein
MPIVEKLLNIEQIFFSLKIYLNKNQKMPIVEKLLNIEQIFFH